MVYVNGIFTNKEVAEKDLRVLEKNYKVIYPSSKVNFINGYNPSHVGGVGDITQAAAQTLGSSVSGFDLTTILLQVHPQITTRKVLLVGHSQGAFYANEMYSYLLAHGEPKAAVGVYHVGSPASAVVGGGKHLNSSGDTVLSTLRGLGFKFLSSNIDLVSSPEDAKGKYPGHAFSGVYLAEAPERVVGDIQGTLKNLKAEAATEVGECFTAPNAGLGYQATKAGFAVADTAALGLKTGAGAVQVAAVAAGNVLASAVQGAYGVAGKLATDIGITVGGAVGITHAAEPQSRATNFDIFSKLYGSSLTRDEYKELLGSAVATAPMFTPEPAPQAAHQEAGVVQGVQAPKKITYLSRSHRSDTDDEAPAEAAESAPTAEEAVPAQPEPELEPQEPSPLVGMVVINELAWAGGYSAPADQWIELYNRAPFDVDLSSISLVIGDTQMPLFGILPPGQYLIVERTDDSVRTVSGFPYATTINFAPLTAQPVQVSLALADGTVIDSTPSADACGGAWCAGGVTTSGYADWMGNPTPVSMERIDMDEDGTNPSNWASNDGYTRHHFDAMQQQIIGTPGNQNSNHWPLRGFFCGDGEILVPGATAEPYSASGRCTGLMGGTSRWMSVGGGVFKGEVGDSAEVGTIYFPGRFSWDNQKWGTASLPVLEPGEYFVAMWEYDNNIGSGYSTNRIGDMYSYLRTGTPQNPGLSYVIIPFIIEGEEAPAPAIDVSASLPGDSVEIEPDNAPATDEQTGDDQTGDEPPSNQLL